MQFLIVPHLPMFCHPFCHLSLSHPGTTIDGDEAPSVVFEREVVPRMAGRPDLWPAGCATLGKVCVHEGKCAGEAGGRNFLQIDPVGKPT